MTKYKYQYGVGLSTSFKVGMFLSMIISEIRMLKSPIDQSLMLHNLYESFKIKDKKWVDKALNDNLQNIRSTINPRIKKINKHIDFANETIKGLDFKQVIPNIRVNDVMGIVRKRLRSIFEVKDAQNMSNELFDTSLSKVFQKPFTAVFDFIDLIDSEKYIDETQNLGNSYQEGIKQALNVCSIGYYSTSVFIAGKTIEEVINDYFSELFRLNRHEKFELADISLKDKIGKLYGQKLITEDIYHRLSNTRIDRNEFGHPSKKLLSKKQAHLRIQHIAEIIPELEKKIEGIRRATN